MAGRGGRGGVVGVFSCALCSDLHSRWSVGRREGGVGWGGGESELPPHHRDSELLQRTLRVGFGMGGEGPWVGPSLGVCRRSERWM